MGLRQLASDDFTGADGPLSASWTALGGATPMNIKSNQANVPAAIGTIQAFYTGITWPNDQSSQATVKSITNYTWIAATARHGATQDFYYAGGADPIDNSSSNNRRIWKNLGGTRTSLASEAIDIAVNDVLRTEVQGTTVKLFLSEVERLSVVDTSIATGSPGFIGRSTVADTVRLDDWRGFDFLNFAKQVGSGFALAGAGGGLAA